MLLLVTGSSFGQTTYNVDHSQLHDDAASVFGGVPYNPFSRLVFTTTAGSIDVLAQHHISSFDGSSAWLGVKINGVMQAPINYNDGSNESSKTVTLGNPGISKTVELINGPKSGPYGSWYNTFVKSITYPAGTTLTVIPPTTNADIAILGNSITSGWGSTNWVRYNFVQRLRDDYGLNVLADAYACRSLKWFTDYGTTGLETPLEQMNRLVCMNPTKIFLVIGTNDYGYEPGYQHVSTFATDYVAVLDTLHARLPGAQIFCVTMFNRANEGAMGHTAIGLAEYRQAIVNAVQGRSYVTLLRGEEWAPYNVNNFSDGVHPSDNVHSIIAQKLAEALGQEPPPAEPPYVPEGSVMLHTSGNVSAGRNGNVKTSRSTSPQ